MSMLLASVVGGPKGGGILAIGTGDDGDEIAWLDHVSTGGMAVSPDGARLVRSLTAAGVVGPGSGELLVHDRHGVVAYHRLDLAVDVHEVLARADDVLVVSTGSNAVVAVDAAGRESIHWQAPGTGDAWHLNSMIEHDGRLLVCGFGRFAVHRGWCDPDPSVAEGRGELVEVGTGERVLGGLSMPHDPRPIDGGWLVCSSLAGSVQRLDVDGRVVAEAALGGWTRGLAVVGDRVHVGLSVNRHVPGAGIPQAELVTLGLDDLAIERRTPLPAAELYSVVAVDEALADGVGRGLRTNPARVRDGSRWRLFDDIGVDPDHLWTSGDRLEPALRRARLKVLRSVPATVQLGRSLPVECVVVNRSTVPLGSVAPHPVRLGCQWIDAAGVELDPNGSRADLLGTLPPNGLVQLGLDVAVPTVPGRWTLRIGVLQEGVAWFVETDPDAERRFVVDVVA